MRTSQPSARSQAANCSAPGEVGAPAGGADHGEHRAAGCGCRRLPACRREDFRQNAPAVEVHHAGIFAAPLRAFELAQHRRPRASPPRNRACRPCRADAVRAAAHAPARPLSQRIHQFAMLRRQRQRRGLLRARQRAPHDAVGRESSGSDRAGRPAHRSARRSRRRRSSRPCARTLPRARAARPAARFDASGTRPSVLP